MVGQHCPNGLAILVPGKVGVGLGLGLNSSRKQNLYSPRTSQQMDALNSQPAATLFDHCA